MIAFHRLLIGTAILFCAGFAVWILADYGSHGEPLSLGLGLFFVLSTLGLGYYLKHLRRFLGGGR